MNQGENREFSYSIYFNYVPIENSLSPPALAYLNDFFLELWLAPRSWETN